MTGAWSCIVRFACHIPMGVVAFNGRGMHEAVKGLDAVGIYNVIPGGRAFLSGLQMLGTWVSRS